MHAPLAVKAGVNAEAVEALRTGARPKGLAADEELALDFAREQMTNHGVSEPTWLAARALFGEQGAVELSTLIGYFVMVSWLMNVARTPAQATSDGAPLDAFPQ
jgi:4-carboxymuconolactone decarboxylase